MGSLFGKPRLVFSQKALASSASWVSGCIVIFIVCVLNNVVWLPGLCCPCFFSHFLSHTVVFMTSALHTAGADFNL